MVKRRPTMTDDDEARLLDVLEDIHAGKLSVVAMDEIPEDASFCGDLVYEVSSIWKITVFNDCNSFDYIDNAVTPGGFLWDFDDLWQLAENTEGVITPRKDGRNRVRNYRGCICHLRTDTSSNHSCSDCEKESARIWGIPYHR